jgi:hypothetical protein
MILQNLHTYQYLSKCAPFWSSSHTTGSSHTSMRTTQASWPVGCRECISRYRNAGKLDAADSNHIAVILLHVRSLCALLRCIFFECSVAS